ncbi:phage gp6-like head-tail connector protein [Lentzea sp. BCCO 10_0798]|uniref:Phage gp6-like head-tail connector protein n=1 Tax=Lentzea kristufekii TaxID=3095430 RepID=A0ABU4TQ41_9PSEU|nr:phage gp6-like head-tail connector protein [Lentzea sp. BCCO 10_0798]MDX8050406.1 phage gp6-like head-tail connector protein [Lentzea sp. BCCO 10_0798]
MLTPYIQRAALKESLGIDDDEDDDALDRAILSSSLGIDHKTGRTFGRDPAASARTYRSSGRLLWTDDGWHEFLVDDVATDAGLVVEIGSASGGYSAVSGFITGPDNALVRGKPINSLLHPTGWPFYWAQLLRVTAVWGWPSIPADIEMACQIQAGRLYRRKDSPEGVTASTEWGPIRVARLDPDVKDLIDPYVLPGFG